MSKILSRCFIILMTVDFLYKSVLYSQRVWIPSSNSLMEIQKSNMAEQLSVSKRLISNSGNLNSGNSSFWRANITWNNGFRLRSRSTSSSSTNISNGISCVSYASKAVPFTRSINSKKVGFFSTLLRSTKVLTKNPKVFSVSLLTLLAIGVPMAISSCPV